MNRRARRGSGDEGLSLVLAAMCLLMLVIATAFVVDLGAARGERRKAQNAVDAAALAGVADYTSDSAAGRLAAMQSALVYLAANGYRVPTTAQSGTTVYPCTSGGCSATFSFPSRGASRCLQVRLDGSVDTAFAQAIDIERIAVAAEAVGCRQEGTGQALPAIYAGNPNCSAGKSVDFSGSGATVRGAIVANGDVSISGQAGTYRGPIDAYRDFTVGGGDHTFTGVIRYGRSARTGGGSNVYPPGSPRQVGFPTTFAWPIVFNAADYRPGGARAVAAGSRYRSTTNDLNAAELRRLGALSGTVLQPGLYYTTRKLDLDLPGVTVAGGGGVTFVAEDEAKVKWNSPGHVARPFEASGLFILANYQKAAPATNSQNCDSSAADLSDGTGFAWQGILYVPRGQAKFSGSGSVSIRGSVLAQAISVSGQDFTLLGYDGPGYGGATRTFLDT